MLTQSDIDYHLRRERQERGRAQLADDGGARDAHLKLAEDHARRARAGTDRLARMSGVQLKNHPAC